MSNIIQFPQEIITKRAVRQVSRANLNALISSLGSKEEISEICAKFNALRVSNVVKVDKFLDDKKS